MEIKLIKSGRNVILQEADNYFNDLINQGKYLEVMNLSAELVHNSFRENIFLDYSFYYPQIDNFLVKISEKLNANLSKTNKTNRIQIIIGTEFYAVGGHSRVARELNSCDMPSIIIATDIFDNYENSDQKKREIEIFFSTQSIMYLPKSSFLEKADYLMQIINKISPERIIICSHHQDPIPLVACAFSNAPDKYYLHHCDHQPAIGASVTLFNHLDTSEFNTEVCKKNYNFQKIKPLKIFDSKAERINLKLNNEATINYFSIGSSNKYYFNIDFSYKSYPYAIRDILKSSMGCYHHIGNFSESEIEIINMILMDAKIDLNRFVYHGAQPNLSRIVANIENPVFIPSFPLPGGMTVIEVMGSGVPLLVHYRHWHGGDKSKISEPAFRSLLPQDVIIWDVGSNLMKILNELDENYERYSKISLNHYNANYSKEIFWNSLK